MMRVVGVGLFFAVLPALLLIAFGVVTTWPWKSLAVATTLVGLVVGPIIYGIRQGIEADREAERQREALAWAAVEAENSAFVHALLSPDYDARRHLRRA